MHAAFFIAPFVAAALAQETTVTTATATATESSGTATVSVTSVTTEPYSNGATSFLTQTNSLGVVTGQPSVVTSQPALDPLVTSQPTVATIPNLGSGLNTIAIGNRTNVVVSVGSSTTTILGESFSSIVTGPVNTAGQTTGRGASGSNNPTDSSNSASASSSSTAEGAAATFVPASGALLGLGAFMAVLM